MKYVAYTDGGAHGNMNKNHKTLPTDPAGWAYKLTIYDNVGNIYREFSMSGAEFGKTNNQMELTAVKMALLNITRTGVRPTDEITVYLDSNYVRDPLQIKDKLEGWHASHYKNKKNRELWEQLYQLKKYLPQAEFIHVDGHSGVDGNEFCHNRIQDAIARIEEK